MQCGSRVGGQPDDVAGIGRDLWLKKNDVIHGWPIRLGFPGVYWENDGMARGDPAEQAVLRLEARRFGSRCDMQSALIQRADSLRELARLAIIPLPFRLGEDYASRDAQRRVSLAAEERAREIIREQIDHYLRAEPERQEHLRSKIADDWANLTGALSHLRTWAQGKLMAAQQSQ